MALSISRWRQTSLEKGGLSSRRMCSDSLNGEHLCTCALPAYKTSGRSVISDKFDFGLGVFWMASSGTVGRDITARQLDMCGNHVQLFSVLDNLGVLC
jgi:hypothetical protein